MREMMPVPVPSPCFTVLPDEVVSDTLTLECLLYDNQVSANSRYPSHVKIVEVGPRDGLQNEKVLTKF